MMAPLRQMMMEDPMLQIEFDEASQTISIRLMGEIQKEILKNRIYERTGIVMRIWKRENRLPGND